MLSHASVLGIEMATKASRDAGKKIQRTINEAVIASAHTILRKSNLYVPVDTTVLMKSGRVVTEGATGRDTVASVIYGGPGIDYAVYVHENTLIPHAYPTCAKFLERGTRETKGTRTAMLGKRILELKGRVLL